MKKFNKKRNAFTLIEMVIVLFIISVLLLIMIPNLAMQKEHADTKANEAFRTTLKTQTELYLQNENDKNIDNGKQIDTVHLDDLKQNDYISQAQVNKAKKLNIDPKTDNLIDKLHVSKVHETTKS